MMWYLWLTLGRRLSSQPVADRWFYAVCGLLMAGLLAIAYVWR